MNLPLKPIAGDEAGKFKSENAWQVPTFVNVPRVAFVTRRCYTQPVLYGRRREAGLVPPCTFTIKTTLGAAMYYVILLLASILVGTAFGAIFGPRNQVLFVGSLIAIALGIATLVTGSWVLLAIGTAVFLVVQGVQRDPKPARA